MKEFWWKMNVHWCWDKEKDLLFILNKTHMFTFRKDPRAFIFDTWPKTLNAYYHTPFSADLDFRFVLKILHHKMKWLHSWFYMSRTMVFYIDKKTLIYRHSFDGIGIYSKRLHETMSIEVTIHFTIQLIFSYSFLYLYFV